MPKTQFKIISGLLISAILIAFVGVSTVFAMTINIQVEVNGGSFQLDTVEPGDTIDQIKFKIEETFGTPVAQQILMFGSVALSDDGRTLADYGVGKDATVTLYTHQLATSSIGTTQTAIGATNVLASFNSGHACTNANLTVDKLSAFPGLTSSAGEMPVTWTISSDCAGEFSLDLTLCYTADELANANSVTEANLVIFKNTGGATWANLGGVWDGVAKCVNLSGVSSLSRWTMGDPNPGGPTPVFLRSLSGRGAAGWFWLVPGLGLTLAAGMWLGRSILHRKER